jgi:hypothetical protein
MRYRHGSRRVSGSVLGLSRSFYGSIDAIKRHNDLQFRDVARESQQKVVL